MPEKGREIARAASQTPEPQRPIPKEKRAVAANSEGNFKPKSPDIPSFADLKANTPKNPGESKKDYRLRLLSIVKDRAARSSASGTQGPEEPPKKVRISLKDIP